MVEIKRREIAEAETELGRLQNEQIKAHITEQQLHVQKHLLEVLRGELELRQRELDAYANQRQTIETHIGHIQQELLQLRETITRSEISLPFNAHVGAVKVKPNEFVAVGSVLFEATDADEEEHPRSN